MSEQDIPPLIVITTFNRQSETRQTLEAFHATIGDDDYRLVIADNGSSDGTAQWLNEYVCRLDRGAAERTALSLWGRNIGCPRALNRAIEEYRKPGQPVVKIDNDVVMLTPGWIGKVRALIREYERYQHNYASGDRVAMVGAYYDGVTEQRVKSSSIFTFDLPTGETSKQRIWELAPIIGHTVWHTGLFVDCIGHFDILHPDHLYGFEDLLASHKASRLEMKTIVWEGWKIGNIQRHSALGKNGRDEHVKAMRPFYDQRRKAIAGGGTLYTGPDGLPADRRK